MENFIVLLEAGKGRAFAQRIPCPNAKPGEVFLEKIPAKLLKLGCSYTVELIMQQKAIFWGSYPAVVLATSDVMHVTNIETKMTQMVSSSVGAVVGRGSNSGSQQQQQQMQQQQMQQQQQQMQQQQQHDLAEAKSAAAASEAKAERAQRKAKSDAIFAQMEREQEEKFRAAEEKMKAASDEFSKADKALMRGHYDAIDVDGSNSLSLDEMTAYVNGPAVIKSATGLAKKIPALSKVKLSNMFAEGDMDQDGEISFDEFLAVMHKADNFEAGGAWSLIWRIICDERDRKGADTEASAAGGKKRKAGGGKASNKKKKEEVN
jgi:Ca2+-binding EF-hand superfamily protein